jgi:hypothetical protein
VSVAPDIDDDYLDALVMDVLYADDELSLLDQRLLRRQDRLRQIVSERAWRRYLRVEEIVTLKLDFALTNVARSAFVAGWRGGRARPHEG